MEKPAKIRKKKKLGSYPYFSVVLSITIALFVLGLFGLFILHTQKLTKLIRENIEVQIYLNKNISENQQIKIQKTLSVNEYIAVNENNEPKISFISKEEAAEQFRQETGEDFSEFLKDNPLRDAFVINIKPQYLETNKLDSIKRSIEDINGVFEAEYRESLVNSINQNVTKIGLVLAGFIFLLILLVVILINNTIKLALFSQRFLIRSMQLIGATKRFIQKPFLYRSFMHGIISGIIAAGLLYGLLEYANTKISDLESLQETNSIIMLFGALVLIGAILGFLSTLRAMRKYMKMSLDDLF